MTKQIVTLSSLISGNCVDIVFVLMASCGLE